MKKEIAILPLFQLFIKNSENGKRLKNNGEKIKTGTIANYYYTYNNLKAFCDQKNIELRICDYAKLTKRERISEKNYWKKFYKNFTGFYIKKDVTIIM